LLKKTITYTNPFTDEEVSEEHYFHISKADLVAMAMEDHNATYEKDGEKLIGLQAKLQKVVDSEDGKAILAEFKDIIRRAYGKKDGDRFLKSEEIWNDFSSTEAFSQLLFDLSTDANAASEFINGIIPKNLDQIAADIEQRARALASETTPVTAENNGTPDATQLLTQEQAAAMDANELQSGLAAGRYKLS
jgi:hypothetical protein